MISNRIKRQLQAIDWDFPVPHPGVSRPQHWYPGTFPSQLPAAFIQALSRPGDIVFDPYGGVGTTASEALRLGRRAWVTDLNPVGLLANYVYCALLLTARQAPEKLRLFFYHIDRILYPSGVGRQASMLSATDLNPIRISPIVSKSMRPSAEEVVARLRRDEKPTWSALEKWMHRNVIRDLIGIAAEVAEYVDDPFMELFADCMLSANLRAISSQNKSWGHVADNVLPRTLIAKDATAQVRQWLHRLENSLARTVFHQPRHLRGIQYWADLHDWGTDRAVRTRPRSKVNLLITSPPYGDAIDYVLSQKLSLYFLGFSDDDIARLCQQEIGARRKRFKSDARQEWANQIAAASIRQARHLDGGAIVTILPHKNHGREVGMRSMTAALKDNGWTKVVEIDRSINQKKARQSWTSIKQETICVFVKG